MPAKNLTLYIPADLAEQMDGFTEVNWSKIARDAIEIYIQDRIQTSVPSSVLNKLRKEKGKEFADGKKFALEEIVPQITYRKLDEFFKRVNNMAEGRRSDEAAISGVPIDMISIRHYLEEAALSHIWWFFGKLREEATDEFARGILSVIEETWKKLQK